MAALYADAESPFRRVKYVFFDFMGTCLDWHTSITAALSHLGLGESASQRSDFALAWRQGFFDEIHRRFSLSLPPENIDTTHRRVLDALLEERDRPTPGGTGRSGSWPETYRITADEAWHHMAAWPDVAPSLAALKRRGYELFVLANGTTRLQLDLAESSRLRPHLDLMFSSEMLGLTKPDPAMYRRAIELVGAQGPDECAMVAAHAYDVQAARELGMRTIYVSRWSEDQQEDIAAVRDEHDAFVAEGGFEGLLACLPKVAGSRG